MAFTVNDFQDLLELLRQNPAWQAQLRRAFIAEYFRRFEARMDLIRGPLNLAPPVESTS